MKPYMYINNGCYEVVSKPWTKSTSYLLLTFIIGANIANYCIFLIIQSEKLLLFHIFTFIPQKGRGYQFIQAFIVITCKNLPKNFHGCEAICKNVKVFHRE